MKIRWGVIGAAGIADRRTIPGMTLAKNAELVAVMELEKDIAEKIRAKYQAQKAYDNVDDLLADSSIDAVYIASPIIFHKEQAIKAAKAGKHILLEKPAALTVEDGEAIAKVCAAEGVQVSIGFMMRFHAYHRKMKEIVDSGRLGSIVSCRGQLTCWYPDIPGSWRQKESTSGGGALMDMGVHCIDLIQYITGAKAQKVTAFTATKTFNYEVEDSASVLFELDNGAFCYVDSNFNIPDAAAKCRLEIYGTRGSLLAEGTISQVEGGKLDAVLSEEDAGYDAKQDRAEAFAADIKVEFGNMYAKEIESFGNAILTGTKPPVSIAEALHVQKVAEAAYQSAKTGKVVGV